MPLFGRRYIWFPIDDFSVTSAADTVHMVEELARMVHGGRVLYVPFPIYTFDPQQNNTTYTSMRHPTYLFMCPHCTASLSLLSQNERAAVGQNAPVLSTHE
jgi:hypothetical protein